MRSGSKLCDIDLNLLVLLDALMTTRHLSKAARQLGMTQSAASQALGRLRRTLDDELFVRARGGMMPTPKALELAKAVSPGLAMLSQALGRTGPFDPATSNRTFRVAFGMTPELELLPPIVAAANQGCPSGRVVSVPGTAEDALGLALRAEVDLCFDYARTRDRRLRCHRLEDEEMVVIARARHPRLQRAPSAAQFFRERHVVLAVADERRAAIDRVLARDGERRDVVAEVGHYASVPPLVLRTDAIAIVPRSMMEVLPHRSRFQIFRPPMRLPALPVFAIWHEALEADPGHAWFRNVVLRA